ncbi:MAG: dihydrofolate reductase, partial [Deltaproteobacteria bacterium]
MKRVLVTNPIMQRDLPRFEGRLRDAGIETVVHPVSQALDEAQLLRIVPGFDGVIAGDDPFTARVLEAAAPRLKVISKWGVGLDAIDLEAAKR